MDLITVGLVAATVWLFASLLTAVALSWIASRADVEHEPSARRSRLNPPRRH